MEEEEEEKEGGAAVARLFNVMMADVLRFTDCHSKLITKNEGRNGLGLSVFEPGTGATADRAHGSAEQKV